MEQGLGSGSNPPPGSIDKSRVLDIRPLRCLVPLFPNPPGMSSVTTPQPTPFVCVPPSGPFPAGVQPFYPFLAPNDTQNTSSSAQNPAPVPLSSFRTPTPQGNWARGRYARASKTCAPGSVPMEEDGFSIPQNQSDQYPSGFSMHDAEADGVGTSEKLTARQLRKRRAAENVVNGYTLDVDSIFNSFLTSFKLKEFDDFSKRNGDKDTVRTVVLAFDLLRRKLTQLEEAKNSVLGTARRPDLKACNLLMTKGFRTNNSKRVGHVPGVEVGDIFFFRMELCLVGIHAPSMAGIDYMTVKVSAVEEPVAICIVSSGGYDDDGDDCNMLIYSGHGGIQRKDGQMFDQKLERGNLALEKSLHRANDVRVIRGIKDNVTAGGKIYVYDGLYKIQESWAETNKLGCNVFKYKLVRAAGQPEAFSVWKSIQQWKDGTAVRPGIILTDLTSGAESQPVALVNEVDGEKGPAHFTYISTLKYSKPFSSSKPSVGCHCLKGCQPGDNRCSCNQSNDGCSPYSSLGVLQTDNPVIYECGLGCRCPPNCRSRISQRGVRVRLEVFKTNNRGWGLRSWDPIRAGGFICEYAGEAFTSDDFVNESDNNYIFDATRYYEPLGVVHHDSTAVKKTPFPLVVSAKSSGNVARFMNHSCSPNVFWQPVLRESNNESYLHIAFFAIQHIPPMQELTFDYGVVSPEKRDKGRKKCLCGSLMCKGYFY